MPYIGYRTHVGNNTICIVINLIWRFLKHYQWTRYWPLPFQRDFMCSFGNHTQVCWTVTWYSLTIRVIWCSLCWLEWNIWGAGILQTRWISSFYTAQLDAFGNMKESPRVTRGGLLKMKTNATAADIHVHCMRTQAKMETFSFILIRKLATFFLFFNERLFNKTCSGSASLISN